MSSLFGQVFNFRSDGLGVHFDVPHNHTSRWGPSPSPHGAYRRVQRRLDSSNETEEYKFLLYFSDTLRRARTAAQTRPRSRLWLASYLRLQHRCCSRQRHLTMTQKSYSEYNILIVHSRPAWCGDMIANVFLAAGPRASPHFHKPFRNTRHQMNTRATGALTRPLTPPAGRRSPLLALVQLLSLIHI